MDDDDIMARTIRECREAHDGGAYFNMAEEYAEEQWNVLIRPLIQDSDFSRVMELAPGHGRITERLLPLAGEIHLVDVNESCIRRCRERLAPLAGTCRLFYYVNDGRSLAALPAGYFTFLFSWDSMVHFDRRVVRAYLREFARVLEPGGAGFIHHSNYGKVSDDIRWREHPGWRSNMSRELFRRYAEEAGLQVTFQKVIDWVREDLDCLSVFSKPEL